MRVGVTIAAAALVPALVVQGAPILIETAAVLASQPATTSTTLSVTHRLISHSEVASESSLPSGEGSAPFVNDSIGTDQSATEELWPRGTIEELVDATNEIIEAIDTAKGTSSRPDLPFLALPPIGGRKRSSAFVGHDPILGRRLDFLRFKTPKQANGRPDLVRLASLAPEQNLADKYERLMKRIRNASLQNNRAQKRALKEGQAQLNSQDRQAVEAEHERLASSSSANAPHSFAASAGAKRPLEDDGKVAHAGIKSSKLPRLQDGRIDTHRASAEQLETHQDLQRLLRNVEQRVNARLSSQSTAGSTAEKSTEHAFDFHAASSARTGETVLPSSRAPAAHQYALTGSSFQAHPLSIPAVSQQHDSLAPSTSASTSLPPVPSFAAPPVPLSPSGSDSSLHHWSWFDTPLYSPHHAHTG